jgi:hypothetical protein
MNTEKESPKPRAAEQKPAAPKNGELSDQKLEEVAGGGGVSPAHGGPVGPGG